MAFWSWSKVASANATADATINWAEGQSPGSVNDSSRAMMARTAEYRDDIAGALVTGGTSTAFTIASNQVFNTLANMNGAMIAFTPHATSGATPTLNVDGLGAKVIRNATGVALPTGALLSGSVYHVTYFNAAGEWLLHNQPGVLPTSSVTTTAIADANVTLVKMDNLAQNTFIGRYAASTGVPQALTLSAGLAVNASTGAVTTTTNPSLLPGFLSGLELSTAGSSATFGIAVGCANDSTSTALMLLASAYTKTTSAWAIGSGNGALDFSTVANNTWYHVFIIQRPDTGVVDVLFSTSASSPTMPTNYTLKRRIGSMKTNGSAQWILFSQFGDDFLWALPAGNDINTSSLTSAPTTFTMAGAPTGVKVLAQMSGIFSNAAVGTNLLIQSPDTTPAGPDVTIGYVTGRTQVAGISVMFAVNVRTNTSAQVSAYASNASTTIIAAVLGWRDNRGR